MNSRRSTRRSEPMSSHIKTDPSQKVSSYSTGLVNSLNLTSKSSSLENQLRRSPRIKEKQFCNKTTNHAITRSDKIVNTMLGHTTSANVRWNKIKRNNTVKKRSISRQQQENEKKSGIVSSHCKVQLPPQLLGRAANNAASDNVKSGLCTNLEQETEAPNTSSRSEDLKYVKSVSSENSSQPCYNFKQMFQPDDRSSLPTTMSQLSMPTETCPQLISTSVETASETLVNLKEISLDTENVVECSSNSPSASSCNTTHIREPSPMDIQSHSQSEQSPTSCDPDMPRLSPTALQPLSTCCNKEIPQLTPELCTETCQISHPHITSSEQKTNLKLPDIDTTKIIKQLPSRSFDLRTCDQIKLPRNLLGTTAEDVQSQRWRRSSHPLNNENLIKILQKAKRNDSNDYREYRIKTKDRRDGIKRKKGFTMTVEDDALLPKRIRRPRSCNYKFYQNRKHTRAVTKLLQRNSSDYEELGHFSRVRRSELSVLHDEAKSFMSPVELKHEDNNTDTTEIILNSKKQKVLQTSHLKSDNPNDSSTSSSNENISIQNLDCEEEQADIEDESNSDKEEGTDSDNSRGSTLKNIKFSFETERCCESWYKTFQRQDKGELYERNHTNFNASKPFLLPYEMSSSQIRNILKSRNGASNSSPVSDKITQRNVPTKCASRKSHRNKSALRLQYQRKCKQRKYRLSELIHENHDNTESDVEIKEIQQNINNMFVSPPEWMHNSLEAVTEQELNDVEIDPVVLKNLVENCKDSLYFIPSSTTHQNEGLDWNILDDIRYVDIEGLEISKKCEVLSFSTDSSCTSLNCSPTSWYHGTNKIPAKSKKKKRNLTGWPVKKRRKKIQKDSHAVQRTSRNPSNNNRLHIAHLADIKTELLNCSHSLCDNEPHISEKNDTKNNDSDSTILQQNSNTMTDNCIEELEEKLS